MRILYFKYFDKKEREKKKRERKGEINFGLELKWHGMPNTIIVLCWPQNHYVGKHNYYV